MKNNSPTYNYADIQRYVNGEMSSGEMRQLELAALDDPFLADALEGFRTSNHHISEKHIKEIESYILGEEHNNKVVPLWNRNKWLSVAAILLLILGATWLSTDLLNNQQQELAVNKTKPVVPKVVPKEKTVVTAPETKQDSGETSFAQRNKTSEKKPEQIVESPSVSAFREEPEIVSQRKADSGLPMIAAAPVAPQPNLQTKELEGRAAGVRITNADQAKQASKARNSFAISADKITGLVQDKNGKPVEGASVTIDERSYLTDKNGSFVTSASDSNKTATVASVGMETKEIKLNKGTNTIQLENSSQSLSEVVVVGYGTKKKRSVTGVAAKPAGIIEIDTVGIKAPVAGWQKLKENLIANITESSLFQKKSNITISFTVNSGKSLRKIKTEKTDNAELSDAIIDYLESEEFWLPSEERIRLVIRIK